MDIKSESSHFFFHVFSSTAQYVTKTYMMAAYLIALTEASHFHKPFLNMNLKYIIHIIYIYFIS